MALQTMSSKLLEQGDASIDSDEAQLEHSQADGCNLGVPTCNIHIQSSFICFGADMCACHCVHNR